MAAESVGLAASVAGLLSLGLQITGGIVKYMDAFEGRDDELRNVKKQNDNLGVTLHTMKSVLAGMPGQSSAVAAAADQNIRSCEEDLRALEALCIELSDHAGSTWTKRLENKKKKATFAFHRPKLRDLELQLQKAHGALQLIQGSLGLETSNRNTALLGAIESSSRDQASEMLLIRSEVAALATPVADIKDKLPGLQCILDQTGQLVVAHSRAIKIEIHESSQRVRHDVQHSHNSTVKHLKTIDHKIQILGEENNSLRKLVLRVASKPAALERLCDDVDLSGKRYNQGTAPDQSKNHRKRTPSDSPRNLRIGTEVGKVCICPRLKRSSMQMQMQRCYTYLSGEWESQGHWSSCPLSNMPRKQRIKASLKYTGVSRLLKSVIEFSFALTSGAGGCSISPSFTYYPTADNNSDPAFRLINVIRRSFQCSVVSSHIELLFVACLRKLAKLLVERRTYPTVVDDQNMTLMHHAASSIKDMSMYRYRGRPSEIKTAVEIFSILLSYGVPAFSYDIRGLSPLHYLTYQVSDWVADAVEVLSRANLEFQPVISNRNLPRMTDFPLPFDGSILLFERFPEIATAFECGPLSTAIINNDSDEVDRVLRCSPDSIAEIDIYGRSPLHLAATKPEILGRLVRSADLGILNQRDRTGANALETAMVFSSRRCVNGRGYARCKRCSCYLCAKILLDAGCNPFPTHGIWEVGSYPPDLSDVLEGSSELARRHYVFQMRKVRSLRIPGHALTNKSLFTKQEVGEKRTTSDIQGSILQAQRHLQICDEAAEAIESMSDWIFQQISSVHLAQLFYRHGFKPRPSVFLQLCQPNAFRLRNFLNPEIVCWLLEHGGDLLLRSPSGPVNNTADDGVFAAHYVFYLLGKTHPVWLKHGWIKLRAWTNEYSIMLETMSLGVTHHNLTDGCFCPCSTRGCSPFVWMMKGFREVPILKRGGLAFYPKSTERMVAYYSSCGHDLTLLTYIEAIRFMTFEALDLVHSCCNAQSLVEKGTAWTGVDDVEIMEDQGFLLELHEELVAEFTHEAGRYLGDGLNDLPLFPQFWKSYWTVRMTEELAKLDGEDLTVAERRDAEELGVVWDKPTQSNECEGENPYDLGDVEHYFFELDLICPEYNEPWPEGMRRVH